MKAFDLSRPDPAPTARGHNQRALRTWLLAGLATAAAFVAGFSPSPAAAQDTNSLQSISPANGETLAASPPELVLTFNQELRSDDRPVVTLACGGSPQTLGSPDVDGSGLVVRLTVVNPLPRGACTITWSLIDGSGVTLLGPELTTFSVNADPPAATTTLAADGSAPTTTTAFISITPSSATGTTGTSTTTNQGSSGGALWFGRLLSTLGILAIFGGLALIALGWPEGPEYVVTVRYLRAVWIIALLGTIVYLVAFAAKFGDTSFGSALSPGAWLDLTDAGWPGRGALLRLVLVAACGYVVLQPERIIDPATAMWGWGIPGAALIAVALSRVEGPAAWLGVLIGFAHAIVAAIWFGGAALVARVVLAGPGEEDLVHATRAYSRISGKAMLVVVVTGVVQMLRLVGSPFESSHGRVLLLKVVAVAAMVLVGMAARQQVNIRLARAHEMTAPAADRFRRAFGAEAAIGVVVLAFSGWMLALTPAKIDPLANETYLPPIAFVDAATGIDARLLIGPGTVGPNGFRLEIDAPTEGITQLGLRFFPPIESGYNVILQPLQLKGAGTAVRLTSEGLPFNVPGVWTFELIASTSSGTVQEAKGTFQIVDPNAGQPAASTTTQVAPPVEVSVVQQSTTTAPFVTTTLAALVTTTTTG